MISKNKESFFSLLKAGLWGHSEVHDFSGADWDEICLIAGQQSVIGLVAAGIEWHKAHDEHFMIPQKNAMTIIGYTMQLEKQNLAMNSFVAKLVEWLRNRDVYTLLVKGQAVAQCYEKPLWRTCGDIDLFLSDDNYDKAKKFLIPLASNVEAEFVGVKHLGMAIDGFVVELHGSLRVGLPNKINNVLDAIKQETFNCGQVRYWDNNGTQIFMLSKENDIIYVFVHFFNHFYKEGVGLRQICDWCRLMWTYRDSMDRNLIEKRVTQMGLVSEWKAFSAYAVEYLGMSSEAIPMYDSSSKWVRKAHLINRFILRVGNMGHNRDMSHFSTKPYFVRKCISMGRRTSDLINHARIFPLDSLRFFPQIMYSGMRSAMRGE